MPPQPCGSVSWSVDTTAPILTAVSAGNNTVVQTRSMTLFLQSNEPLAALLVLLPGAATWTKAAGVGWEQLSTLAQRNMTVSLVASVPTDGLYRIDVKGVDQVGNAQTHALRFCWELDTTSPTVRLTGAERLPVATSSRFLTFNIECDESPVLVWWAVDGSLWTKLRNTSSFTAAVDGDGEHFLHLTSRRQCWERVFE